MEKGICENCKSSLDKKTGLCPKCDAEKLLLERKLQNEKKLKNEKLKGIIGIVFLSIVFVCLAVLLFHGITNGYFSSNKSSKRSEVEMSYEGFLNDNVISKTGVFDINNPLETDSGAVSSINIDLNNDGKSELLVVYFGNNYSLNISCYSYSNNGIINLAGEHNAVKKTADDCEMLVYSSKSNNKQYIIFEYLSCNGLQYSYNCRVYGMKNGSFSELRNVSLSSENGNNDISSILKPYGEDKMTAVKKIQNSSRQYQIEEPDDGELIFDFYRFNEVLSNGKQKPFCSAEDYTDLYSKLDLEHIKKIQ